MSFYVCVFVHFIVMPRTSGLVPCQVVPSQLAVAHAFVLCYAQYSAHNTHCCEESFTHSPSLVVLFRVCVSACVSFMAVTLMWRELETQVSPKELEIKHRCM